MLRFHRFLIALIAIVACCALGSPAFATDTDGPFDCQKDIFDFGDAPEAIPAYPVGAPIVVGAFPTCLYPGPTGTQSVPCPAISTPPGPAGHVIHVQFHNPANYWLGCYFDASGAEMGIDTEFDGKVNTPPVGFTACATPGFATDCVEPFEGGFDQDECYLDGSDAGVKSKVKFSPCKSGSFSYEVYLCPVGITKNVILNVLVDWNKDGDWNDNFVCPDGTCTYEWAVKNATVALLPGCNFLTTPSFSAGPFTVRDVWMRVTISDFPVTDDFPWAGSVTAAAGDRLQGGETEDYLVDNVPPVPVAPTTWGSIKALYR